MSKGGKTGGKNFKRGVSGNPKGRPPDAADLRAVKHTEAPQAELDAMFNRLRWLTGRELDKIAKNLDVNGIERAFAKCLYLAGRSGDTRRLEAFVSRMVGRIGTPAPDSGAAGKAGDYTEVVLALPDNGRVKK